MDETPTYREIEEEKIDRGITEKIIGELDKWRVPRSPSFDRDLADLVGEIRDRGVEIGEFLSSSRRIVFKGKYNDRDVVIKFSHAIHTIDHDERQQQKEEAIWDSAVIEGDARYFAEIIFGNMSSRYVVQEYCHDLSKVEDSSDLKEDYQNIAAKYNIRELLLGVNCKNLRVFVDYGL